MLESGPVPRSRQSPATRRAIALVIGLVAIAGLASGLFVHKLLVDEDYGSSMACGLRACDSTYGTATITTSNLQLIADKQAAHEDVSSVWAYAGLVAWIAALVAIVGLVLALIMVATGKYVRLPVMSPTTIALLFGGIALISGCIFVASKPAGIGVTQIGWTFWSFGGGSVLAVIAAFLLSRQLALIEPEFDPGESPELPPDEPWQDP
jgi:hypothetical protein